MSRPALSRLPEHPMPAMTAARAGAVLLGTALLAAPIPAFAHPRLRSAQPPVGGSVHGGVQDIRIAYSEGVEPQFCQVAIMGPDGKPVEAAKPAADPAEAGVLVVHLAQALPPGAYQVRWRATGVDTHKTDGSYGFTVTP